MMSRIPLTAAVVGALLVGGATTGVTRASWTDQRQLHAHGATAGSMSFTATSPGAVSVDKVSTSTAETSFVLDDTSAGKNLQQRITATIATTPAGITATVGTSCASATTASVAVDTTPTSPDQSLCVRVMSSTTAVSGTVTINLLGAQQPTGWSTPLVSRSFQVTANDGAPPAAPMLACGTFQSNGVFSFAWPTLSGVTYTVYRSTTTNADASFSVVPAPPAHTSPYSAALANPSTTFWRVKATNPAGTSGWSNTVRLTRTGNGNGNHVCALVTP